MRWHPIREHPDYGRRHHPQVGDLIAYKYRPWVVAEIRTIDDGRTAIALRKPGTPDVAASIELHLAAPKLPDSRLHVLPERYAVCSCCGELAPCSSEIEDETVKAIQARDARYEVAGVCPACQEVVTPRQKSGRPEWRVPVDMQVKPIITEGRPSLSNMSGFNRDNTWTTATEEAPQVGSEHGEWSCRDPRCGVLTYAAEWCPGCGGSHVSPASETEGSR